MSDPLPKPRRSRLRRWTLRLFVVVITLAIVVIVTVQIVLGTGIPKQIVIAQVQNALGLRVNADSLSTGWFGHTTLKHVTLSLPLSESAFCEVPELRVTHTNLLMLLLTQSLDLYSIEIDQPKVTVTQDAAGRWNLQDVVTILARLGGGNQSSQQSQKHDTITLPAVTLRDGEIDITDNQHRHAVAAPLNARGTPINALAWQYDVSLGDQVKLTGRVAPNDRFSHNVEFTAAKLAPLVSPWMASFDPNATIAGQWRGAKTDDGVAGRLNLKTVQYSLVHAENGDIAISSSGNAVTIAPSQLLVHIGDDPRASLNVTGGTIGVDPDHVKLNQLQLSVVNGRVRIDATAGIADQSADAHVRWDSLRPAPGVDSTGEINATVRRDWPDRRTVKMDIQSTGTAADGDYTARATLTGAGKTWDAADWTFNAPSLKWNGPQALALSDLTAHLQTRSDQLVLTDVSLANSSDLSGKGVFHLDRAHAGRYDWWLYLTGQNWSIPRHAQSKFAFALNSWGDQDQIRLDRTYVQSGIVLTTLDGSYRFAQPKPVDLFANVYETQSPTDTYVKGQVRGESELIGTLLPVSLSAAGQLHGEQLVLGDRPLQKLDVKYTGNVDENHFAIDTAELALLGGQWAVHVESNGSIDTPRVVIKTHDLPLAEVGNLLHQSDIAGIAAGSITIDVRDSSIDGLDGHGHFTATGVKVRQFALDSAAGDLTLHDGQLQLAPIQLKLADGTAEATLQSNLHKPQLIAASLKAAGWPVSAGSLHAVVSADAQNLQIDAMKQSATGTVQFGAAVNLRDQALVLANGQVQVAGRVLNLDRFDAKALDGTASGTGSFDLDQPLAATGKFRFDEINLGKLQTYDAKLADVHGVLNGRVDLAPANDPRALAPLMLDIAAVGRDAGFRSLKFDDAHIPIWIDARRAVLDSGKIDMAGGNIGLFARGSKHVDGTYSLQVESKLTNLDLQQFGHSFDQNPADKKKSYPALVDGSVTIVGDPNIPQQMFGSANLHIHDSDLGELGGFSQLYDLMHLGGGGKNNGDGTLSIRYDNDAVVIDNLHYFNRGAYAYGLVTMSKVSQFPDSPLDGNLVGTIRPLRNIKLPFFADADKIFSVLQSNLTSIVISGTFANKKYAPQSATEIGDAMRRFLLGDVPTPK